MARHPNSPLVRPHFCWLISKPPKSPPALPSHATDPWHSPSPPVDAVAQGPRGPLEVRISTRYAAHSFTYSRGGIATLQALMPRSWRRWRACRRCASGLMPGHPPPPLRGCSPGHPLVPHRPTHSTEALRRATTGAPTRASAAGADLAPWEVARLSPGVDMIRVAH